jgi:hypothetical protein
VISFLSPQDLPRTRGRFACLDAANIVFGSKMPLRLPGHLAYSRSRFRRGNALFVADREEQVVVKTVNAVHLTSSPREVHLSTLWQP